MNKLAAYDKMKDPHITWMGCIPAHWSVQRAKFHFIQTNSKGNTTPTLLAATQKYGMYPQDQLEGVVKVSEGTDLQKFKTVHKDDFVISLRSFQGGFERSDFEGVCSPAYQTFHQLGSYDNSYLKYLFKCDLFVDNLNSMTVGIREGKNIRFEDFANSMIFIPPIVEQEKIVSFLNDRVSLIDSVIEEAKKSIEEYSQWKNSAIFETVTKWNKKDLNETGIQWVGKAPKGWKFVPIKQIILRREGGAWGDEAKDNDTDRICMRIADFSFETGRFRKKKIDSYTVRNYSQTQIEKLSLRKGDILVEKSGGGEKTPVGRAVLYDLEFDALFANFMERIQVDTKKILPEFFIYYWRAMYNKTVTTVYIKQTIGIQNLNVSGLLENEYIPLVPFPIQKQIIAYLDDLCNKIDDIISNKQMLVAYLENYKRSLIYEVVTGKRKVV